MLTAEFTNVPVGEEWKLKATPPAARSVITTTADHSKVFDMAHCPSSAKYADFARNKTSKFESIQIVIWVYSA
jgi:hypothetical protein